MLCAVLQGLALGALPVVTCPEACPTGQQCVGGQCACPNGLGWCSGMCMVSGMMMVNFRGWGCGHVTWEIQLTFEGGGALAQVH
jgi:hypothetical protein